MTGNDLLELFLVPIFVLPLLIFACQHSPLFRAFTTIRGQSLPFCCCDYALKTALALAEADLSKTQPALAAQLTDPKLKDLWSKLLSQSPAPKKNEARIAPLLIFATNQLRKTHSILVC
jgi:hypothetical protein